MRVLLSPCLAVLCSASLLAQQPVPQFDAVAGSPSAQITCNARWVYVLTDGQLHQFDAETLSWKKSVPLPGVRRRPGIEVTEVTEVEVIGLEPPEAEEAAPRRGGRKRRPGPDSPAGKAVQSGIEWLVKYQDESGRWSAADFWKNGGWDGPVGRKEPAGSGSPVHDIAVTGLSLLALMGDGNTMRVGPHKDAIKRGVKWLREQQDPDTGLVGVRASHDFIYDHAIATLALSEAAGLSDSKLIKKNAQRAIDYLESHRNPYGVWRYDPRGGDNDTSVTGWCGLALRSAKDHGLIVNDQAMQTIGSWVEEMTDPATGRVGYIERGGLSSRKPGDHATAFPRDKSETMTAAGLMLRVLSDTDPKGEMADKGAELLLAKTPRWDEEGNAVDPIGWYFGTFAMYQRGGRDWRVWSKAIAPALLENQRKEDRFKGSWNPAGPWGEDGGRVMSTALGVMTLQVSYRYSRLIR